MVKYINLVLLVIFVTLVLIFTTQNPELVSINFLGFQSIKLLISVIVYISVIIGILIGLIYHFYTVYRIKKELKSDKESQQL
jgi:uncharacterized integral membrane protein